MPIIWITYDCLGRTVEFSEDAWNHILDEHSDLAGYQWGIKQAVERPYICTRELDESWNYYGLDILPRRHAKYLHVLVRNGGMEAEAQVHTAWPTDAVDPYEEALC